MPKKEPSRSVEQKSGPVGSPKTSFDAARSAFNKAKDAAAELKGAVAYLDRGPEDFSTDDVEEDLDSKYGEYRDTEPEELRKRLAEAEKAAETAKEVLRERAIEEAKSALESSDDMTQEQLTQAKQTMESAEADLRTTEKKRKEMERTEEKFLEEYRMPWSKAKDQAGIQSDWESSVQQYRSRLAEAQEDLKKAKHSYDELRALNGNVFTRLLNSSKIKALQEGMGLEAYDNDPDKMLGNFQDNVERALHGLESNEASLKKLNTRIKTGAFSGRTPEYEAEFNAVKAQIEDLTLKQMQAQKQVREMEAMQSKLATLIDVLELPASKNIDEQKRTLSDYLAKQ